MDAQELKERIITDEKIELILDSLGMHHIKDVGKYITCAMPDGDNTKSTTVYKDNLHIEAYTRNIEDAYGHSDIISLVSFINNTYMSESVKWICDICGYDYYGKDTEQSSFFAWVNQMWKVSKEGSGDDEYLKPIDERVLSYFKKVGNKMFYSDGIDYETQWLFEIGYDLEHHAITIPIRDEIGSLVGVKARLFKDEVKEWESKYFYLEPCTKSRVLYGLHKTLSHIRKENEVIVVESEKAVLQLWTMGVKNAVAISGHKLSKHQVQKLTHLGVSIVLAFDEGAELGKDGKLDKNYYQGEFNKFLPSQELYVIFDKDRKILNPKESPSDDPEKWFEMYENYRFKVRGA